MKEILDKYCVPQLFVTVNTVLGVGTNTTIGTILPTQIALIYGISISTGQVDPGNNTLITPLQAAQIYLQLKKGAVNQLDLMRLDKLQFYTGVLNTLQPATDKRFLEMIIPGDISLDQSIYVNPTGINTTPTILLELWYLTGDMVQYLINKGAIDISMPALSGIKNKFRFTSPYNGN